MCIIFVLHLCTYLGSTQQLTTLPDTIYSLYLLKRSPWSIYIAVPIGKSTNIFVKIQARLFCTQL